ncbi:MAG: hypothetical protein KDA61_19595, partial [Planctomycetales bacterium]|nr:hypothetical protein [Planctomycetales bacterium]
MFSPRVFRQVFCGAMLLATTASVGAEAEDHAEWQLVWSDEFSEEGPPNPENWTYEQGFVRNEELQWYQ